VEFRGRFIDERGKPLRGEPVSLEITGPTIGAVVPPHWTRSDHRGGFKWEGVPFWWTSDAFDGQPRQVCLSHNSRYVITGVAGEPLASGGSRCANSILLDDQPVVFALKRK
jgi:hypothetical protein